MQIGTRLSHYQIVARLGAGGMGEVYRAHDHRLRRDVAIKVLPPETLQDEGAGKRLRREALALSRLNHPNICTVHDFDTHDGIAFIVVELIDGETLAERLRRGRIAAEEIVRIGRAIASALEVAHEQGVIHRDLKPGNVMISSKGVTKVLDFGLARDLRPAVPEATTTSFVSNPGIVGTLPYMAPEQVLGEETDARTDVYALGVILFEMATGRRPFDETQPLALASAILNQAPPRPPLKASKVDAGLAAVILRCLEKRPERRYPSAAAASQALAERERPTAIVGRLFRAFGSPARIASVAGALALVLGTGILMRGCGKPHPSPIAAIKALAVLPLRNLSGDPAQEYFADGLTEELIANLGQVSALRVTSRTSVMQYKNGTKPLPEIARALAVDYLIEGAVLRTADQVRITARIIEAAADRLVWSGSFDRSLSQILSLPADVTSAIVSQVRVRMTPDEKSRVGDSGVVDPAAYEAYLRGRAFAARNSKEAYLQAIQSYTRATTIQPTLAPAHAGIAVGYLGLNSIWLSPAEAMPRAKAAALRALAIDSTSAEASAALAYINAFYEFDWDRAERGLRNAIRLNSSDAFAHQTYGYFLTVQGRFQEAAEEIRRARASDPFSQFAAAFSIAPLYEGRRYDAAIQAADEILSADPTAAFVYFIRGQARLMKGDPTGSASDIRRSIAIEENAHMLAYLALAETRAGHASAADSVYRRFRHIADSTYVQPYTQAIMSIARGDRAAALEWLKQGIDQHTEEVSFLKVDPVLDPLRSEPAFRKLMQRLGFTT